MLHLKLKYEIDEILFSKAKSEIHTRTHIHMVNLSTTAIELNRNCN